MPREFAIFYDLTQSKDQNLKILDAHRNLISVDVKFLITK